MMIAGRLGNMKQYNGPRPRDQTYPTFRVAVAYSTAHGPFLLSLFVHTAIESVDQYTIATRRFTYVQVNVVTIKVQQ